MIKKIRLENFLAHGSTEFELDKGMTVLTGPNNSGKSSIVEALRCISTNPTPKYFIRHGAKKAKVELELEDGVRVVWIREKGHARYEVYANGQEEPEVYAKFGRKPPEDVLNLIRLNLVPLENGNSLDVHIGNQRNPVFLLDQSPGVAAQFFASSSEAAHLLAMQTELKNKVKDAKRDRKNAESRMQEICSELDELGPLPDVELELEKARELKYLLDATKLSIPKMENLLNKLCRLAQEGRKLTKRCAVLGKVLPAQDLFSSSSLAKTVSNLEMLAARVARANVRAGVLKELEPTPQLFDSHKLSSTIENYSRIAHGIKSLNARKQRLDSLITPPDIFDVAKISTTIRRIVDVKIFRDRVARRGCVLAEVLDPPQLFELTRLQDSLNRVSALRQAAKSESIKLQQIEKNRSDLAKIIRARLEEEGQCPLCGADLDAERFMEESS